MTMLTKINTLNYWNRHRRAELVRLPTSPSGSHLRGSLKRVRDGQGQSDQTYYVSVHHLNRRIGREIRYVEKVPYISSEDK